MVNHSGRKKIPSSANHNVWPVREPLFGSTETRITLHYVHHLYHVSSSSLGFVADLGSSNPSFVRSPLQLLRALVSLPNLLRRLPTYSSSFHHRSYAHFRHPLPQRGTMLITGRGGIASINYTGDEAAGEVKKLLDAVVSIPSFI